MSMKCWSLLWVGVMLPSITFCQDYLITTKGDTVRGKISLNYYDLVDRAEVRGDKKRTSLMATQVREAIVDGITYRPQKLSGRYRFMRLIKSGYLSLYGFRALGQSTFDSQFLVRLDGRSQEVPHLSFKSVMSSFLKDCPELADRVESGEKGLGKKNLEKIIDEYNACIDQKKTYQPEVAAGDSLWTSHLELLESFRKKVIDLPDFANRQDALDLMTDMEEKLKSKQAIPNYLLTGLSGYLANSSLKEDLEALVTALGKH